MKILFAHFPLDSDQIEGTELPRFFAMQGHQVHSVFIKNSRKFIGNFLNDGGIINIKHEELRNDYDVIVCKSDAFQKYARQYASDHTKIINVTPMGIKSNLTGVTYGFTENQLIKAPVKEMQEVFSKYRPWDERKDQIITVASMGTDKNQLEFIRFFDPFYFPKWKLVFVGAIKSNDYVQQMKAEMTIKKIDFEIIDAIDRKSLAKLLQESKLSALTTDPRPSQPYDPGPRVVFESIRAGTPCFLSDLVMVHEGAKNFSFFYEHQNKSSFTDALKHVSTTDLKNLSYACYDYGSQFYTMQNACNVAYNDIMNWC
jgi:glycosyltransferase involved in cell wall biosynthesis